MRNSSIELILRLLSYISLKSKIFSFLLLFTSIICGLLETLILIFAVPIINIITSQDSLIYKNDLPFQSLDIFNIETSALNLTITFSLIVIFNLIIRIVNLKILMLLSSKIATEIATRGYANVINQNFTYFEERNTSEMISSFAYDFNKAEQAINAFFVVTSAFVIGFILLVSVIALNRTPGLIGIGSILLFYIYMAYINNKKLKSNSEKFSEKHMRQTKLATEDFRSIKDIILNKTYNYHIKKFKKIDFIKRRVASNNIFTASYPKYIVESIILLFLSTSSFYSLLKGINNSNNLAFLGTLGLACLRIIPILQLIYSSWSRIEGSKKSIVKVFEFVNLKYNATQNIKALIWDKEIKLKFESFKYKGQKNILFENQEFVIRKGEKTVIVGESGSGKTTIINFLMGLQFDPRVKLNVDDYELSPETSNKIIDNWHASIGHISQNGLIIADTITNNIAFGKDIKNIDLRRIKQCAREVQIYDFITKLKFGFNTLLFEEGKNLSEGQRQRILLARALYSGTSLLVIDEGTSALDENNENQIIQSLNKIGNKMTIVLITHNRKLVKYFSNIIDLDKIKKKKKD